MLFPVHDPIGVKPNLAPGNMAASRAALYSPALPALRLYVSLRRQRPSKCDHLDDFGSQGQDIHGIRIHPIKLPFYWTDCPIYVSELPFYSGLHFWANSRRSPRRADYRKSSEACFVLEHYPQLPTFRHCLYGSHT